MKKRKRIKIQPKKGYRYLKATMFFLLTVFLFLLPYPTVYTQKVPVTHGIEFTNSFKIDAPPPFPVKAGNDEFPKLSAEGILIQDMPSGVILYSKNAQVRLPPASTTKIMTALVGLDAYKTDDVLTVGKVIKEGRVMGLVPNEKITFESLLYGALVHSANDAAFTIAENYPGGEAKFYEAMNNKAKEIYLTDTHFTNSIGFDDPDHYTTAIDLAKQAMMGLHNKLFSKIVSTKSITVSDAAYSIYHPLTNVNELLGKIPGISGVKTGFTENAGEILVSEVKKNGRSILIVVLHSRDRFGDTSKIIDWTFRNFVWKEAGEVLPDIRQ